MLVGGRRRSVRLLEVLVCVIESPSTLLAKAIRRHNGDDNLLIRRQVKSIAIPMISGAQAPISDAELFLDFSEHRAV